MAVNGGYARTPWSHGGQLFVSKSTLHAVQASQIHLLFRHGRPLHASYARAGDEFRRSACFLPVREPRFLLVGAPESLFATRC